MRRLFEAVFGAVAVVGCVLLSPILRPWYRRWGATDEELDQELPGDELVPRPRLLTTRAITIRASARTVWSWLVQIGQGRAGFYSYDALESAAGYDVHNADHVIASLQSLDVGDRIRLGGDGAAAYMVVAVETRHWLVLRGGDDQVTTVWSFWLDTLDSGETRLVVRDRTDFARTLGQFLVWRVLTEPIHFVMERKMLLGLKARAERSAAQTDVLWARR